MAFPHGSLLPKFAPTVTTNAVTAFNQQQATYNATVSANKYVTTVYFDYSTSSTFNTYTTVTYGNITTQSTSVSWTVSGLSVGTVYYVRCRAVNAIGTTIGSAVSFTTWSLQTYTNTTAGAYSVSIPSITGVAPVIYEMLLYGGGGGANYAGGGGGGYRLFSSHTSSVTGTQTISGSIGGGGAGGNGGTGTGGATAGGSTTLTIGSSSWTAGGGGAGNHPGTCGAPSGKGGSVGSGANPANVGGDNTYGYYYIASYTTVCTQTCFQCTEYSKIGVCVAGYDYCCASYESPNYAWDCNYYAGGGGGGTDANGASAATQSSSSHVGGAGGAGGGAYGLRGGNGGGGRGTQGVGTNGSVPSGSGFIVGTGGQGWYGSGVAGGITFKYYGP